MPRVDETKRYVRVRQKSPRYFDPKSLRTIDPGKPGFVKLIIGCKKGRYDRRRRRCRIGTEAQSVLLRKKDFTKQQLKRATKSALRMRG